MDWEAGASLVSKDDGSETECALYRVAAGAGGCKEDRLKSSRNEEKEWLKWTMSGSEVANGDCILWIS
jgi:hypothetical protein